VNDEGLGVDEFDGDGLCSLAGGVELRREQADPPLEVGAQPRHPNLGNAVGLNDLDQAAPSDAKVGDAPLLEKDPKHRLGGRAVRLRWSDPGHRLLGVLDLLSSLVEQELEMIGRE